MPGSTKAVRPFSKPRASTSYGPVDVEPRLHEVLRSWRESDPSLRRRVLLLVAMVLALAVQIMVWLWYIDDAAISFSFARNLADGHGLVAQAGGERVEGYSNPLWVALMALWAWIGVKAHRVIPERLYFAVTYTLLTVTGGKLIFDAVT